MTDLPPDPATAPATLLPFTVQHGRAWKATRRAPWIAPATEPRSHRLHDTRAPSWLVSVQQIDAPPALDFTAWAHPVLAVPCPTCRRRVGRWCVRPSGHRAMDLHAARRAAADRAFMEQHGATASLALVDGRWLIDSLGRAGIRPRPEEPSGDLTPPWDDTTQD